MRMLLIISLLLGVVTCKFGDFSDFSSFRSDEEGNDIALLGLFMNDASTVMSGEFFPFELYSEKIAVADEQGTFKGFAADIVTDKDPLGGFRSRSGIEEARNVSASDPHYFGGYYLKIMIVHDDYMPRPKHVQLLRGYFPDDFSCPKDLETVRFSADDNAIDPPSTDKLLGIQSGRERNFRTVKFCQAKEKNGKYKGKTFYYTRVSLFDESTSYVSELYDERNAYEKLYTSAMQAHEMVVAAIQLQTKSRSIDTRMLSVLGLTYDMQPAMQEMLEKLSINTVHDYNLIVETTDAVQKYIYTNKHRLHGASWETLLLAQRKWLAIRAILKKLPQQSGAKSERMRQIILNALETADFRDAMPLALTLINYSRASNYLDVLTKTPEKTVINGEAKSYYFSQSNNINNTAYALALESIVSQWKASEILYSWVIQDENIFTTCANICPAELKKDVEKIAAAIVQDYQGIKSIDRYSLHATLSEYIEAVNKIYPDPRTDLAVFKGKWIFSDTIDYDNSSDAFKMAYQRYSQRYDMIFGEPHGSLLATKVFIDAMGKKRSPSDLPIMNSSAGMTYDWKMHSNVQITVVDAAIKSMFTGLHQQFVDVVELKKKINNNSADEDVLLVFLRIHHAAPIAKALLIRPDYATQLVAVLPKYQRKTFSESVGDALSYASIAATVAAVIVSAKFAKLPHPRLLGTSLFGAGLTAEVTHVLTTYHRKRTDERRLEGALFADLFGNDMQEYMLARRQLGSFKRDLYLGLGLSSIDFIGIIKGLRIMITSHRAVTALRKISEASTLNPQLVHAVKNCSTRYCRNFLHGLPFIAKQAGNDLIDQSSIKKLVSELQLVRTLDDFDAVIKRNWFNNPALMPLAEMELMEDILTASFAQRIFGKGRRMTNTAKRSLWIMSDKRTMDSMTAAERLDVLNELLVDSNRNRTRKIFSLWKKNKDHFRTKGANMALRMTDKEMVAFYKELGVINKQAPQFLGVNWWQGKKYANVLNYLRGNKIINEKMLKNDKKTGMWRKVLKAINPHADGQIKVNGVMLNIDELNTAQLQTALQSYQHQILDLTGRGEEIYDLKARTRMMRTLLNRNLGKFAVRNPNKEFIVNGKAVKTMGYDIREEVLDKAIDQHKLLKDYPGDVSALKKKLKDNMRKRLSDKDGLVQSLEHSFNNWLVDYNAYLTGLGKTMNIPKP